MSLVCAIVLCITLSLHSAQYGWEPRLLQMAEYAQSVQTLELINNLTLGPGVSSPGASSPPVAHHSIDEKLFHAFMQYGGSLEELYNDLGSGNYVFCYAYPGGLGNGEILEAWIEKFKNGEVATIYTLHENIGFGFSFRVLECDGSGQYTITAFSQYARENASHWQTITSSVIVRQETNYIFGSDLSTAEWFEVGQRLTILHTSLDIDQVQYDAESQDTLGNVTPEEACAIAQQRIGQNETYCRKAGSTHSYSVNGPYFELNMPASSEHIPTGAYVDGAVLIAGQPCYKVRFSSDPSAVCAVNADGGNLCYLVSAAGGEYILLADGNREAITATPKKPEARE